jgi:hypothetical protein
MCKCPRCCTSISGRAVSGTLSQVPLHFCRVLSNKSNISCFLRGVRLVLGDRWDWIQESEIRPLFAGIELDNMIVSPHDVTDAVISTLKNGMGGNRTRILVGKHTPLLFRARGVF